MFSLFINTAERKRGAEKGEDDHTQPPGLINKQQNRVPVCRSFPIMAVVSGELKPTKR